jgi:hypothetical protein
VIVRIRFHAWNAAGRILRYVGDRLARGGHHAQLRLYGWSGTTDAIADQYRR